MPIFSQIRVGHVTWEGDSLVHPLLSSWLHGYIFELWRSSFLNLNHREPTEVGFFCGDESIAKPYKSSTVSSTWLFSVGFTVPAVIILVAELGEKTEWNWRVQVMVMVNPASDVNFNRPLMKLKARTTLETTCFSLKNNPSCSKMLRICLFVR